MVPRERRKLLAAVALAVAALTACSSGRPKETHLSRHVVEPVRGLMTFALRGGAITLRVRVRQRFAEDGARATPASTARLRAAGR